MHNDYSTIDAQNAFLSLPLGDQGVLRSYHQSIANIMNGPKTIEIAGYTILAMPLEAIAFTQAQQKQFEEAGGIMNPTSEEVLANKNPGTMMYWTESFEALQVEIQGILYNGFGLFKKVYEAFPMIQSMTQDEATGVGLYPTIHYRNFAACKWMAEMYRGHLASLDTDYRGELRDLYNSAPGKTNLQKLASMGQAPFGWRDADNAIVYCLGSNVSLGSGSLDTSGNIRSLDMHLAGTDVGFDWYWQRFAVSNIVVLNK